jgi:hypothetical protein
LICIRVLVKNRNATSISLCELSGISKPQELIKSKYKIRHFEKKIELEFDANVPEIDSTDKLIDKLISFAIS